MSCYCCCWCCHCSGKLGSCCANFLNESWCSSLIVGHKYSLNLEEKNSADVRGVCRPRGSYHNFHFTSRYSGWFCPHLWISLHTIKKFWHARHVSGVVSTLTQTSSHQVLWTTLMWIAISMTQICQSSLFFIGHCKELSVACNTITKGNNNV